MSSYPPPPYATLPAYADERRPLPPPPLPPRRPLSDFYGRPENAPQHALYGQHQSGYGAPPGPESPTLPHQEQHAATLHGPNSPGQYPAPQTHDNVHRETCNP